MMHNIILGVERVLANYVPPLPLKPGETYTLTPHDRLDLYYSAGCKISFF